jgi:hypothetical protein
MTCVSDCSPRTPEAGRILASPGASELDRDDHGAGQCQGDPGHVQHRVAGEPKCDAAATGRNTNRSDAATVIEEVVRLIEPGGGLHSRSMDATGPTPGPASGMLPDESSSGQRG